MLGVLLESRAARQRRDGGAAMSVATHVALIGLVAAATAKTPGRATITEPVPVVRIVPPSAPRPAPPPSTARPSGTTGITLPTTMRIPVPVNIPTTLPPIDLGAPSDPAAVEIVLGSGDRGIRQLGAVDLGGGAGGADSRDWSGAETLMRLLVSAKPRYPERLRAAGISGRVRVRFLVDTTGRVDLSSVQFAESTHDDFTRAVREILPQLRFKASEANGQRVRSLAEMPFEFQITR
jgi:protein TonB